MKNRVKYIDIARGIAILCIILGHLGNATINRIVYTFHVPIFFLITGYFMSDKMSTREFCQKRIRTLILPYVYTCILMILFSFLKGLLSGNAISNIIKWTVASLYGAGDTYTKPFYINGIGAIWFLLASFWASVWFKIILSLEEKKRLFSVVALFLAGYYSAKFIWLPLSIQAGCCAVSYIYVGYMYKKVKIEKIKIMSEVRRAINLLALVVWLDFIKNFKSFWMVHCDFGRGIMDILGCLCGCYVIIKIAKLIQNKTSTIGDFFAYIGEYSIFILCIHLLELNLFPWWKITNKMLEWGMPHFIQLPIIIVGKFVLDIFVAVLCSKCDFIRKIFGMQEIKHN